MYKAYPQKWVVKKPEQSVFDEGVTFVEIVDEAAGMFLEITQSYDKGEQTVRIDVDEWPKIRDAVETAVRTIETMEGEATHDQVAD